MELADEEKEKLLLKSKEDQVSNECLEDNNLSTLGAPFEGLKQGSTAKADEPEPTGSVKELLKNKVHLVNLLILIVVWVASSFDYYLINF